MRRPRSPAAGTTIAGAYRRADARILLFAKAPVPGQVKTRLIPALGAAGAARLHQELLTETLARIAPARIAPIELWCAPTTTHRLFHELARRYGLELHAQPSGGLGQRLLRGAADALLRANAVVLIGGDCPDLGRGFIDQAFEMLLGQDGASRCDAVLGPAADGGYVLLGLRRAEPTLFRDMPWGTERVAALTRERMANLGWCWQEQPMLRDLDRPADLEWYRPSPE
jgi:rSAM/selenodomain-associated transferase 1